MPNICSIYHFKERHRIHRSKYSYNWLFSINGTSYEINLELSPKNISLLLNTSVIYQQDQILDSFYHKFTIGEVIVEVLSLNSEYSLKFNGADFDLFYDVSPPIIQSSVDELHEELLGSRNLSPKSQSSTVIVNYGDEESFEEEHDLYARLRGVSIDKANVEEKDKTTVSIEKASSKEKDTASGKEKDKTTVSIDTASSKEKDKASVEEDQGDPSEKKKKKKKKKKKHKTDSTGDQSGDVHMNTETKATPDSTETPVTVSKDIKPSDDPFAELYHDALISL